MQFLDKIKLIQGGMGVYVSNWRLAKAVAIERPGETAGTVSGTALDVIYVRLLQLGDPGGHVRRALQAFDERFGTGIGQKICDKYFVEGGKEPEARFKSSPVPKVRSESGSTFFASPNGESKSVPLKLYDDFVELLVASGFAETWLAKEDHYGKIFMNFLHKIEIPLIFVLYGAMLAGVDGVVVGAGNPDGLPAICESLSKHEEVTKSLPVLYRTNGEDYTVSLDPQQIAEGKFAARPIKKPAFLAIASLEDLVQSLAVSKNGIPDGFVIEHHSAGGHNANPVGPMRQDGLGQPIYSEKDEANLEAIRQLGIPFWLAGGYGSADRLQDALSAGASGIQVGSTFALANESGMKMEYRAAILNKLKNGADNASLVRTTMFSPTGFSFKVVQLEGTLSDEQVFDERRRICDIGLLQQLGLSKPGEGGVRRLFQRCPAAPIDGYVKHRGLARNTETRRCLCNGLLSCVGMGQIQRLNGKIEEEPAIVTLGADLTGIRRLSRQGQTQYWARDVVADILG